MSVALSYRSVLTAKETLTSGVADVIAAAAVVTHDQFNTSLELNANTNVPITQVSSQALALAAGTATIDLTSLPGTNGATINGTGLRVRFIKFKQAALTNAAMTIVQGGSNPYLLLGAAWSMILPAPAVVLTEIVCCLDAGAPVIASGAKTILITGTGAQVINVEILLG